VSEHILSIGGVQLSVSVSACDACGTVGPRRAQLTGPHGYVNLCENCCVCLAAHLRIRKAKATIQAIRRAAEGEDS